MVLYELSAKLISIGVVRYKLLKREHFVCYTSITNKHFWNKILCFSKDSVMRLDLKFDLNCCHTNAKNSEVLDDLEIFYIYIQGKFSHSVVLALTIDFTKRVLFYAG